MTNIQIFQYTDGEVRTTTYNGEIAFVAKDVAERLGYIWKGMNGTMPHVPEEWKGACSVQTPGGTQEMSVLTEQGLYFFLFFSVKPLALPFQFWFAGEVIPSLRKTGGYTAHPLSGDELILAAVTELQSRVANLSQTVAVQQARIEADKPKVVFSEAVATSNTDILVGELAKILNQNGVEIGQNRLFERLRNEGYLCKTGSAYNCPTQRAMDMGLFRIKETAITHSDGHVTIQRTTKVTGRGQVYLVNRFLGR
jgi:anti-repressor protein